MSRLESSQVVAKHPDFNPKAASDELTLQIMKHSFLGRRAELIRTTLILSNQEGLLQSATAAGYEKMFSSDNEMLKRMAVAGDEHQPLLACDEAGNKLFLHLF